MQSSFALLFLLSTVVSAAHAQGVPTNDSGLTVRDIVETGDRDVDLATQADKLTVQELISEIERDQLETLARILDAQSSFGGQGLPKRPAALRASGAPDSLPSNGAPCFKP